MIVIDWISLALIGALGISGFFNGFAKEISSATAWVVSIVGAWYFGPLLFPYVEVYLTNVQVTSIASFIVVFIILFSKPAAIVKVLKTEPNSYTPSVTLFE